MFDRTTRRQSVQGYYNLTYHRPQTVAELSKITPDIVPMAPISPRTMDVLSRAARRAARKQVQIERQMNNRPFISGRHSALPSARLGAISAPPNLGQQMNKRRLKKTLGSLAPPIFVVPASKCSGSEEFYTVHHVEPSVDGDVTSAEEEEDDNEEESSFHFSDEDFDRPAALKPPEFTPMSTYRTPRVLQTARTTDSTVDWEWVKERLASHDSVVRPETEMTFYDFLDNFDCNSEEYDTDLEEDFIVEEKQIDPTGVQEYMSTCEKKNIPPTTQVIKNLSSGKDEFSLHHRCLNQRDALAISEGLKHNQYVTNLDLSSNYIDGSGASHLANVLKKNSVISRLDLSNNMIRFDGGRKFADVIKLNDTLTHLCLRHNKITDKEALLLSDALRHNNALQFLDLSHNELSDPAGRAFSAALMENKTLRSFNLSWNALSTLSGAAIGKLLKENKHIRSLDLSYNGLGNDGAALLGKCLKFNSTLRHLSLAVNHIGSFGGEKLALGVCGSRLKRARKSKCGLWSLNLNRNPLGRKALLKFVKYMDEESEKLIELSINQVVASNETISKIRSIMANRSVFISFEGETEEERAGRLLKCGAMILQKFLSRAEIDTEEFFKTLDPSGEGVEMQVLKDALAGIPHSITEIELDALVSRFTFKRHAKLRFSDVEAVPCDVTPGVKKGRKKKTLRRKKKKK